MPGAPNNAQNRVTTGTTGRCVLAASAATPDCSGNLTPGVARVPSGKITICRPLVEGAISLAQQLAKRSRAATSVDRDHATERQQRAEQWDAQQFLLHHVAAARQQRQPDDGVERRIGDSRRSIWRLDLPGLRGRAPGVRMPQIILAAPTMMRAHMRHIEHTVRCDAGGQASRAPAR